MTQLRNTRQKFIIEEEARKFVSFFTADELFEKVREQDPKIGIATVYRYLKDTGCKGELHTYNCDRRMIYSTSDSSHCHFHCTECNIVSHINIKKIDFLKKGVKGRICHFQIDIYGICEACLRKGEGLHGRISP